MSDSSNDTARTTGDALMQSRLISALLDSRCYPHGVKAVRLIETHISWVLLAGRYAYKIKKAVKMDFLDFMSLDARRFYCTEELRLNRRLAPRLYLEVVAIGGDPDKPEFGKQPAFEYAIKMRRFAAAKQLDRLLAGHTLLPIHMDQLAATLARFHANLPAAPSDTAFGSAAAIGEAMRQNFRELRQLLHACTDSGTMLTLEDAESASAGEYVACVAQFDLRRAQGWVREGHGDLHLGNIALVGNEPLPFDCLEFDPALRWNDVIGDLAFAVMDLLYRQRSDLAYRLLNSYLEASGDYAGVAVLRFYLARCAVVRAKVNLVRMRAATLSRCAAEEALMACCNHLKLAAKCVRRRQPALIITYGLPGSGKSTWAKIAVEQLSVIRVRSDVERKRLFGIAPPVRNGAHHAQDIYSKEAGQRTYTRLRDIARILLSAGFPAVIDAAFLQIDERERFRALAAEMAIPFAITWLQADEEVLRSRIISRLQSGNDASEADLDVLQKLRRSAQALSKDEAAVAVPFLCQPGLEDLAANTTAWDALAKLTKL